MASASAASFLVLLALAVALSSAYDLVPMQDFCVAVPDRFTSVFVNGKFCKNPKLVTVNDFLGSGLHVRGTISMPTGFSANVADVNSIPGLNTLGLSIIRVDIDPNGVVPPHTHPRATELILLLEGTLYAGFVGSNPTDGTKNRLFAKVLKAGDVFAIPSGMVHFQRNVGKTNALVIAVFNSQNPGVITLANAVFGTEPKVSAEMLAKSFQLDNKTISYLLSRF